MFRRLRTRRGQSTAEYAIVVGVVIAAVIAMQVYMRRSVQAHIKDVYDFASTANYTPDPNQDKTFENMFTTMQYEPGFVKSSLRTQENLSRGVEMLPGGGVTYRMHRGESTKTGNVTYDNTIN